MNGLVIFEFRGAKVRTAGTFESPLFCAADVDRFSAKVDMNGPIPPHMTELGQCWVWEAYRNKNGAGYGVFRLAGRTVLAHRFAWAVEHGVWPNLYVCHRCDNPACVRPSHLYEGDQAANMADASSKLRLSSGESHPKTKLTLRDVEQIVRSTSAAEEIAAQFHVSAVHIRRIRSGKWVPRALRGALSEDE